MGRPKKPLEQRFWAKVNIIDDDDSCWEWLASYFDNGYGRFGNSSYIEVKASRWAWHLTYGPIPDGMQVLHKCDNKKCVRPSHLFLGTNQDNMDDMVKKGRQWHARGEKQGQSKLTESQVKDIRNSKLTLRELSEIYGVSKGQLSRIRNGSRWEHVK